MVQLNQIGLIAHELESIYQRLIYQQLDVSFELIKIIRIVHDDLAERIQNLYQHAVEFPVSHVLDVLQHIEDWLPAAFAEADFTQNQVIGQAGLKLDDQMSLGEVLAFNSVPAASETFPQTLVEKCLWMKHKICFHRPNSIFSNGSRSVISVICCWSYNVFFIA